MMQKNKVINGLVLFTLIQNMQIVYSSLLRTKVGICITALEDTQFALFTKKKQLNLINHKNHKSQNLITNFAC